MLISGFTFIRNGVKLRYPFKESIASLLPLVDELIVNVPESQDRTLEEINAIDSDKIKIIERDWDSSLRDGGRILSLQTNRALEKCSGEWAIYLQSDEVLHEDDYAKIRATLRTQLTNQDIDGISFRFLHFEGSYNLVNPFRYRRQVRIIRNDGTNISWGDACGFRKKNGTELKTLKTDCRVFHYGWVRPPESLREKNLELEKLYHDDQYIQQKYDGENSSDMANLDVCRAFPGTHPSVMSDRISSSGIPGRKVSRLPYILRPLVWKWLLKKWGLIRSV